MAKCDFYWTVNYITFRWFTVGLYSKYTKKVNILQGCHSQGKISGK